MIDSHRNRTPEDALDISRSGRRGEVPVLRRVPENGVAHGSAHRPRLEPRIGKPPRDPRHRAWRAEVSRVHRFPLRNRGPNRFSSWRLRLEIRTVSGYVRGVDTGLTPTFRIC